MTTTTASGLRDSLAGIAIISGDRLQITDESRFRNELVDSLVFDAVFNHDEPLRDAARWLIWSASHALGCGSASIHQLYMAPGRGGVGATHFPLPAVHPP